MGIFKKEHEAVEINEEIQQRLLVNQPDGYIIRVRPDKNNSSFSGSKQILKNLHNRVNISLLGRINTSEINTFEIWYDQGEIDFRFFVKSKNTLGKMLKQLSAFFQDSEITISEQYFPRMKKGEYISGTRFHLKNHYFEPIRHKGGKRGMETDPYRIITNDITSNEDSRMVIQVCLKPVTEDWTSTRTKNVANYGEELRKDKKVKVLSGLRFEEKNVTPPSTVKAAARDIIQQRGKPAFFVNLRAISIAPTKKETIKQSKTVSRTYKSTHKEVTDQTLSPIPQQKGEIPKFLNDIVLRKGRNMNLPKNPVEIINKKINRLFRGTCETMIMTIPEVTSLAHIPNQEIQNENVNWSSETIGGSPPVDMPEFEDFHGGERDFQKTEEEAEQIQSYDVEWIPPVEQPEIENEKQKDVIVAEELLEGYEDPLKEYIE